MRIRKASGLIPSRAAAAARGSAVRPGCSVRLTTEQYHGVAVKAKQYAGGGRPAGSAVRLDPADLGSEMAGIGLGQGWQLGADAQAREGRMIGVDLEADLGGGGLEIDHRAGRTQAR